MVVVNLDYAGEPLFYDPVKADVYNGGNGYTLERSLANTYGGAMWNDASRVSIISKN